MNFKLLKDLIAVFKKKLRCNECNSTISNRNIHIEGIKEDKVLLKCTCKKCNNTLFADVSILREPKDKLTRQHRGLKLKAKKTKKITANDILDVKNFLKSFKGDFKEIFNK